MNEAERNDRSASSFRSGNFPIFFHYVNAGPDVKAAEMITDVYLPLKETEAK